MRPHFTTTHNISLNINTLIENLTLDTDRRGSIAQDRMSNTPQLHQGPPFRPTVWNLGGTPVSKVDIPITAVFLVLYILGAVMHMGLFQRNKKRGHKFIFSALLFGA
jgi:hypothetical protein